MAEIARRAVLRVMGGAVVALTLGAGRPPKKRRSVYTATYQAVY